MRLDPAQDGLNARLITVLERIAQCAAVPQRHEQRQDGQGRVVLGVPVEHAVERRRVPAVPQVLLPGGFAPGAAQVVGDDDVGALADKV